MKGKEAYHWLAGVMAGARLDVGFSGADPRVRARGRGEHMAGWM